MNSVIAPKIEQATRHVVIRDLMAFLPIATVDQTERFLANLSVSRCIAHLMAYGSLERRRAVERVRMIFMNLRVTPDIAEGPFRGFPADELTAYLVKRYGDRLTSVAGFYRATDGWQINLPKRCVLHSYRINDLHAGVLCQPIDKVDSYFLLSSRQQGGPSAERLGQRDKAFFEQFRAAMPANIAKDILKLAA